MLLKAVQYGGFGELTLTTASRSCFILSRQNLSSLPLFFKSLQASWVYVCVSWRKLWPVRARLATYLSPLACSASAGGEDQCTSIHIFAVQAWPEQQRGQPSRWPRLSNTTTDKDVLEGYKPLGSTSRRPLGNYHVAAQPGGFLEENDSRRISREFPRK